MKMFFFTILTFAILLVFTEYISGDDDCLSYFTTAGYVPQFAGKVKSAKLQVKYAGKNVPCGSSTDIVQTLSPPTLYYDAPSCCKNITVLEFAPDFTIDPPYLVWLVLNVPPENLRNGFTIPPRNPNTKNNGYYAATYDVPQVPASFNINKKTTVIFLYCQCGYVSDKTVIPPTTVGRGKFDVKEYAKNHNLGNPIAAYYMFTTPVQGPGFSPGPKF